MDPPTDRGKPWRRSVTWAYHVRVADMIPSPDVTCIPQVITHAAMTADTLS